MIVSRAAASVTNSKLPRWISDFDFGKTPLGKVAKAVLQDILESIPVMTSV